MIEKIIKLFHGKRFVFSNEKELQANIKELLTAAAIPYSREHRLNEKDIPDFFIEGIVLEIKTHHPKRKIYEQCLRYAAHEEVTNIILVTGQSMGNPGLLNGKQFIIININKAWL